MISRPSLFPLTAIDSDKVYTPDHIAKYIVEFFQPTGKILDPCRGEGAFYKFLPADSFWCEIQEGVDFFEWNTPVDWIISNPPYSNFDEWLDHSYQVAENIVYLIPLYKYFNAWRRVRKLYKWGGLKHILAIGPGKVLGFSMGNTIGALHIKKNYCGDIGWSFMTEQL